MKTKEQVKALLDTGKSSSEIAIALGISRRYVTRLKKTLGYDMSKPRRHIVDRNCVQCGKNTINPKFCSKSCSAIWTNKAYVKRKRIVRFCKTCSSEIRPDKRYHYDKYCSDGCNPTKIDWTTRTRLDLTGKRSYQINSQIRDMAKDSYWKINSDKKCKNCGYDKHVEVCHIKAVSSYPDEAFILDINSVENLIGLCPNCHWELDHGFLKLPDPLV